MLTILVPLLAIATLEALLISERPAWLMPLARIRIPTEHRFPLPTATRPVDDATYRDSALQPDEPWRRIGALYPRGLRIAPSARGDAFVVSSAGWGREYVVRVDVARDGEFVVLSARFIPAPIAILPLFIIFPAMVLMRLAHGNAEPVSLGAAVGMVIGAMLFLDRVRGAAGEAASQAFDSLETEITRVASGESFERQRDDSVWRGRLVALVPVILLAVAVARAAGSRSGDDAAVREIAATYGLAEDDARRLATFASASVRRLSRRLPASALSQDYAAISAAGVRRLADAELLELQEIRERLAMTSEQLCAQVGAGQVDDAVLLAALARQDDATVQAWYRLNARAAELELDDIGAPALSNPDEVFARGLRAMVATLPEAEQDAYAQRLWPESQSDAAACDSFRAMSEGLRRLERAQAVVVLRANWTASVELAEPE